MSASPCPCGRIDVHAHFLPGFYCEALAKAGLKTVDGGMPVPAWSPEAHLEMMDRQGIATSMLSVSSPAVHFLPPPARPAMCRAINEDGARLKAAHPDRFGFFASLPLPDAAAALAEIAHAFDVLGADGVIVESHVDGVYLGDPVFAPVFAELNARKAVVFLHPTSPACYDAVALGRPAPMLEFPIDTTRTVVDLIYRGTLKANPDLKLIVPHGGAALTALAARIAIFANVPFVNPRPESEAEVFETLARLYYDVALSGHEIPFAALRRIAPMDRILFGSDWPFTPEFGVARNIGLLDGLGLDGADAAALARGNAETLFPRLADKP